MRPPPDLGGYEGWIFAAKERKDRKAKPLRKAGKKEEAEANINLAESLQIDETPTIIINGDVKIKPSMTSNDMNILKSKLDTTIGSLLTG